MKTFAVKTCCSSCVHNSEKCPFEYDTRCNHPDASRHPDNGYGAVSSDVPPEWCPLRKQPALVQLP